MLGLLEWLVSLSFMRQSGEHWFAYDLRAMLIQFGAWHFECPFCHHKFLGKMVSQKAYCKTNSFRGDFFEVLQ